MSVIWREIGGELRPFVDGVAAVWAPQEGSQQLFLSCPVFEVLLEGARGGGKTDALIMDFAQHVGQGFGAEWKGLLFRQTYKQLSDVVSKTKKWFPRIWPSVSFNESKLIWTWASGEMLTLTYMAKKSDYFVYHGASIPWIGWEELTTWPDPDCYTAMMSCCRSSKIDMPRKYRATTNPYGCGHSWVKSRFRLPIAPGKKVGEIFGDPKCVSIHSTLAENKIMLRAEPAYVEKITAAARNDMELRAWRDGSWDIVAGGMFDDVWSPEHSVIPDIPFSKIPSAWRLNRSYDHGTSKPFSVGWWLESNGEPIDIEGRKIGTVRGDIVLLAEWYGCGKTPNEGLRLTATEIARGILDRESEWSIKPRAGPADSSIFDDYDPGRSVAGDMLRIGVRWIPCDKGPGSRKQGWEQVRKYMRGASAKEREEPGLFVCRRCSAFIRTVPTLPRDDRDIDDVDTESEDHCGDCTRYKLREVSKIATSRSW